MPAESRSGRGEPGSRLVGVSKRDRPAVHREVMAVGRMSRPAPGRALGGTGRSHEWSKCQCEQGQQCHSRSGRWSRGLRQCRRVYACKAGPSRAPRRGIEPSSTVAVGVLRRGRGESGLDEVSRNGPGRVPLVHRGTAAMSAIRSHVVVVSVSGRGAAVTEGHVAVKSGRGRRVAVTVEVSVLVKLGRAVYCSVVWRRMIRWRPSPASAWRAWSGRSSKGLPRDGPGRVPQGPSCGKEVAASPGPGP